MFVLYNYTHTLLYYDFKKIKIFQFLFNNYVSLWYIIIISYVIIDTLYSYYYPIYTTM